MKKSPKNQQLQIRVSAAEKKAIRRLARRADRSLSDFVLSRLLHPAKETFQGLVADLAAAEKPGYVLAEMNDLLSSLAADEFEQAVSEFPRVQLSPYHENYVAGMVELAATMKNAAAPAWTGTVCPLAEPVFGSSLKNLRLHLLVNSPLPFRERNIFIDSSIGDRV